VSQRPTASRLSAVASATDGLVSIVMPTYNRARYLAGAVDHCLRQTYALLELIVVDDGSTDATPDILAGCGDPRVTVLRHRRNRGLPEALNTGFRRARGAYLTWSSDDDRFLPHAVERLVAFLESHPEVGLVYADYRVIDAEGTVVTDVTVEPPPALATHNCVGFCRLYRRAAYEAVGEYDPAQRLAEDYDYWLRVAQRFPIGVLHETLYLRRQHSDSLTARFGELASSRVAARVRHRHGLIDLRSYHRAVAYAHMCEAFEHHLRQRRRAVWQSTLRGLWHDPSYAANRGVLSILVQALCGTRLHRAGQRLWAGRGR
jgi:glycosyltransferase involved in cell wall biosynthesis